MSESKISETEVVLLGALAVALCCAPSFRKASRQAAEFTRRQEAASILRWTEEPRTAAGVLLAQRSAAAVGAARTARVTAEQVLVHMGSDQAIRLLNRARRRFPIFLLLSILGWTLLGLAYRSDQIREGLRAGQVLAGLAASVIGGGLFASLPAATPRLLQLPALALAAAQAIGGLAVLLAAAFRKADPRRLKYGPPFTLPNRWDGRAARRADGITVGQADVKVLPEHTRWSAATKGEIVIPFERLSCGITVLGEKGSGKSRLLFGFHDAIRKKYPKTPLLIHDPKGEWYRTYYDPKTDLVFAPHFHGTTHWSIWSDFQQNPVLRNQLLATAVYAHDTKGDAFWMDSAMELLRSIAEESSLDLAIKKLLKMKQRNAVDKTWLSTYQVAQLGLKDIIKVELPPPGTQGQVLSIDDYLEWPGRIFLLNDPSCTIEQKGAFSLFLSAFMLRALSKPDLPAGQLRAAAIVDEALTFHLPPDIDRLIYALCRSKGLSIIAGAQRLPSRYNHERGEWATAEYLFGMKVIEQQTQASMAKRAGQMHFDQARKGRSLSAGRVSISENDQAERIEAVPPEHFGRLAPRHFILFHDGGLASGRTASVDHGQRDLPMPRYDSRGDVYAFTQALQGAPGQGTARLARQAAPRGDFQQDIGEPNEQDG